MKLFRMLFVAMIAASAGTAFAEGGAERSQEFWKQFKLSQEQVHGSKNNTVNAQATVKADSGDQVKSAGKSEG
ncbi:hypothetical protein [Pseudomonas purpurea]|uniref:hypothetical protein n=1 Tax=Pseudomonas purpurea TaxID=3136737 RepID=UPI0032636EF7